MESYGILLELSIHTSTRNKVSPAHRELTERLRKTLYHGNLTDEELKRPSAVATDIAVELLQKAAPSPKNRLREKYAASVVNGVSISPCTLMLGMWYVERLKHRNPEYLQTVSSSDLFLVSMMVASKYLYDEGEDEEVFNDEWAEAGKRDVEEVNTLEASFLVAMDWQLFTRPEEFLLYVNLLEARIAVMEGMRRGWFSYTDMWALWQQAWLWDNMAATAQWMMEVMCLCIVAYSACIAALVGTTTVAHQASQLTSDLIAAPATSPATREAAWLKPVGTGSNQLTPEEDLCEETMTEEEVDSILVTIPRIRDSVLEFSNAVLNGVDGNTANDRTFPVGTSLVALGTGAGQSEPVGSNPFWDGPYGGTSGDLAFDLFGNHANHTRPTHRYTKRIRTSDEHKNPKKMFQRRDDGCKDDKCISRKYLLVPSYHDIVVGCSTQSFPQPILTA
ncbi:CNPPD1 [Branchiostoma lanceolatum]|uniref:Protein CNPPD1 n=1 Tax=Branchiostoma lanceolatum TaxID=7740 RepID=A0A8J9Z717_BRALA|nr:CNPPD1 [Branchiostoma lanceolatum]